MASSPADPEESQPLATSQTAVMMVSVLVVALCGIAYELIIASVSTYLLGNSVTQFSLTIGLFMFAMGIGSFISKWFHDHLLTTFIMVEIAVALVGGFSSTLLFTVFPMVALYKPMMYGLTVVIGTLVGLEIPLLTRILSRSGSWKESIANVLSLDYLGALLGSVAFPLVLMPSLGLFRSSFVIGLTNVLVALGAILFFGHRLAHPWRCRISAVAVLLCLLGGLFMSARITQFAEGQLFADHIVYETQSPYQRIVVTENDRNGELRLYLDKHLQFASRDEYRYHESLVHPVMSLPGERRRVLVLGGGDGLAVREIFKYPEVEHVDLVDIDPAITELSRTFAPLRRISGDALNDPRVHVINADAFRFVLDAAASDAPATRRYDRVLIDLPDPHNEVLDKLYSQEFYELVRRCLTPSGSVVVQSSSPFYTREVFWCIGRTLGAASMQVSSYHVPLNSFGIWGFHLASPHREPAPAVDIAPGMSRYMTNAVFQAATIFSPDIGPVDGPVNRTFEPRLYTLYLKAANR